MACNASAPELRAAYDKHSPHGLEVLSVSIQETNAEVDAFIARHGLDYPFLMDRTGEISTLYRVTSTPTTFFVAPDGTIVDQTAGIVSTEWVDQNATSYLGA